MSLDIRHDYFAITIHGRHKLPFTTLAACLVYAEENPTVTRIDAVQTITVWRKP